MLVLMLVACASEGTHKAADDGGPIHELLAPQASAPRAAPAPNRPDTTTGWPLLLTYEGTKFEVHEPVVENLNEGLLTARSVVTAQAPDQGRPVAGSVTMRAAAEVDAATGTAALVDTEVLGVSFPAGVDDTRAWREFLRFAVPPEVKTVPLAALESGHKIASARQRGIAAATAPATRIIVSERPAVLVYIDGDPRYVPVKGADLTGVLNTRVLLLKDPQGNYYLHVYDGWVRAAALNGPWAIAASPPDTRGLEQAIRETGRANFLGGKADASGRGPVLSAGHLPDIFVATQPTALVVLDGSPRYTGIAGTTLEYAVNTSAHLFRDTASGDVYVRVDGFWFRASAIDGPWWHAPVASLPAAFAAIPDDSPKRAVKASIAGAATPASGGDMNIVAADPGAATLLLKMGGDPVLEPIRGTELNYVANSSVPIIQVDVNNWYAVQNAVWFFAPDVTGPWTVTSRIPAEIYSIPSDTPMYHAIHSRVMSSSSDVIYYGYPGIDSQGFQGGATGIEEQGDDYQYTPPSGLSWGWFY